MKENKRKSLILMVIGVLTLLIVVAGATYAFFQAQTGEGQNIDVSAQTGTTDSLTFSMDDKDATDAGNHIIDNDPTEGEDLTPITINATAENFKKNDASIADGVTAKAVLKANSTTREANETYNVYLHIDTNELEYSSYTCDTGEAKQAPLGETDRATCTIPVPELILTVKKDGDEVTDIEDLKSYYQEGIEIKYNDGSTNQKKTINGYDITEKGGIIKLSNDKTGTIAVTAPEDGSQPQPTEDTWEITITFINLPTDQEMNTGKQVSGKVIIQKEEYVPTYQKNIDKLLADDTKDGKTKTLFLHDGISTDSGSDQEAGDYSYRYSGATGSVNNYVCLDNQTVTGDDQKECTSNEDLYRIIGLFKNKFDDYEMKLIKADPATSTQLGKDGAYSGSGNNYSWDSSNGITYNENLTNLWKGSNLNKVNLNGYYLNTYLKIEGIKTGILAQISDHDWITAGNTTSKIYDVNVKETYKNEINEPNGGSYTGYSDVTDKTYRAKIGLMYVSDYGYAAYKDAWTTKIGYDSNGNGYNNADIIANNWMYMGLAEWTITRYADDSKGAFIVNNDGSINYRYVYGLDTPVRLSFYLSSSTEIASGDGTSGNPYRLSWNA